MIELVTQIDRLRAIRDQGQLGEEVYDCTWEICPSAVCPCREVTMVLTPASATAHTAWPAGAPIHVLVDPGMRCAVQGIKPDSAADLTTSRAFALHFSDASWDWLWQRFAEFKARAVRNYDPGTGDVDLDIARIEREGTLLPFLSIFSHAPRIVTTVGGTSWMLDDHYCVRSTCQCTGVSVALHEVVDHHAITRPTWEFHIDYRAGTWRARDGKGALSPQAQSARELLCTQHPNLLEELAWRHDLLRRTYAASRQTAAFARPAPARADAKPGRNAPCTCGSGNKYKRCCGV